MADYVGLLPDDGRFAAALASILPEKTRPATLPRTVEAS
jgi:hypothetical protein